MKRALVTYRLDRKLGPYADALRSVGIEPVPVRDAAPESFDGLLLSGGTDLNPALYGQPPNPASEPPDDERDALELQLLRTALARDLPVLAICRGMQLLNVAYRGELDQDIEGHLFRREDPSLAAHDITTASGSQLARILGEGAHPVNSRHHQAVSRVGKGLLVSATAPDGVIEGLEDPRRRYTIAVQWHPEDQIGRFAEAARLFESFRDAL